MEGIVCKGLSKTYDRKTYALKNVSLSFPNNGIIAMIGRNGAGKTTLIRILSTELMPSKGAAYINGIDVVKEPNKVRDIIAIVPQEARNPVAKPAPDHPLISALQGIRIQGSSEAPQEFTQEAGPFAT